MRHSNPFKNSLYSKGFTLIELLVVISIIAVLSSTIFTNLQYAKAKAADAAVDSSVHSYYQAIQAYYLDHGSYYDTGDAPSHCLAGKNCLWGGSVFPLDQNLVNAYSPYISALNTWPEVVHYIWGDGTGLLYQCNNHNPCTNINLIWGTHEVCKFNGQIGDISGNGVSMHLREDDDGMYDDPAGYGVLCSLVKIQNGD